MANRTFRRATHRPFCGPKIAGLTFSINTLKLQRILKEYSALVRACCSSLVAYHGRVQASCISTT